jgi:hypothetical protein
MQQIAENAGARDVFVLRRVAPDRLFNTDGFGRGSGWAGNVSVDPNYEPWIARVLEEGVSRRRSGVPFRAFGPYWSTEVVAIATGDDVVVFGGPELRSFDDEEARALADQARARAQDVSQEKQTADEAEVQQALQALTGVEPGPVDEMARHVASTTAQALSCEFGAVLLHGPPTRVHVADEGWKPMASDDEIIAALMPLVQVARDDLFVEQDLSASSFPYRPLSFDDGLVARCAVPLGNNGELGLLVAAHAGSAPRGFTQLCQRVASTIGEASEPLIAQALNRS